MMQQKPSIDHEVWDRIAADNYCVQPLDRLIVDRLSAALPGSCGEADTQWLRTGLALLCMSLNKGDTYLPLDQNNFLSTVRNWLDIPETWDKAVVCRTTRGDVPGPSPVPAAKIREFLLQALDRFALLLENGALGTITAPPINCDRPLVYDPVKRRLYFERYFRAVAAINAALADRLGGFPFSLAGNTDRSLVESTILATPAQMRPDARQTAALLCALRNRTLLISGGPGTGKTTVVLQILRLLLRALPWLESDDIRLAASTGRAAARLQETVFSGLAAILGAQARTGPEHLYRREESLKTLRGMTVHRLLEYNPSTITFKHSRKNPLDAAVVIVDEISMLDIELFGSLLEALPQQCLLILLGDRFQLPPVEAGAVLGDLTAGFDRTKGDSLSPAAIADVKMVLAVPLSGGDDKNLDDACSAGNHPLRDRAVILTRSHRSAQAIQELANAINNNHDPLLLLSPAVDVSSNPWEVLLTNIPEQGRYLWAGCEAGADIFQHVKGWLLHQYGPAYRELLTKEIIDQNGVPTNEAVLLLNVMEKSRILTVVREGDRGARGINERCSWELAQRYGLPGTGELLHGLPIIITRNAPALELYNGDCGVLVRGRDGAFSALFRSGTEVTARRAGVLPRWETAFAMTVHKSQGSEYEQALLVLPETANPLCTKEILYTAITRAKKLAAIIGPRAVLERGLGRASARNTGIEL